MRELPKDEWMERVFDIADWLEDWKLRPKLKALLEDSTQEVIWRKFFVRRRLQYAISLMLERMKKLPI